MNEGIEPDYVPGIDELILESELTSEEKFVYKAATILWVNQKKSFGAPNWKSFYDCIALAREHITQIKISMRY